MRNKNKKALQNQILGNVFYSLLYWTLKYYIELKGQHYTERILWQFLPHLVW